MNFEFHWSYFVATFLIVEWVLRVVMLFVVPRNRKPSSATAWLMLIMLEPVIGTLVFSTFGSPRLPKYRRALQKHADTKIASELAVIQKRHTGASVSAKDLTAPEEQFV